MQKNPLTILVCPLDWGLGHASRMVPVIHHFKEQGHRLLIGGSGKSLELLKYEFPGLQSVFIPGASILYSKRNTLFLKLLLQIPKMVYGIFKEHALLKHVMRIYSVDVIISDNRYGLWNKNIHSVFVTHQLSPVLPKTFRFLEPVLHLLLKKLIKRFDECWVPDYPDKNLNLAGNLAHRFNPPSNVKYIGTLSRFCLVNKFHEQQVTSHYELVVILSGPEPQRSILEKIVVEQLKNEVIKTLIIRGLSESTVENGTQGYSNISFKSHLDIKEFAAVVKSSRFIICRSGYSNIMDLIELNRTAVLIPTPGQTEQEYLARYLSKMGLFRFVNQNKINLHAILKNSINDKKLSLQGTGLSNLCLEFKEENHNHWNKPY